MEPSIEFPSIKNELASLNLGVVIIGAYYGLEFGSLQGLYPLVHSLNLPTIVAVLSLSYVIFLFFDSRIRFSKIAAYYIFFIIYLIINSSFLTISLRNQEDSIKLFILYLSYFFIGTSVIRNLELFVLLLDIMLAFMAYSCLHGMLQGGLVWGNQWLSDENIYAVFCCTGIPFAFVLLLHTPFLLKKICYGICLSLFIIGVFLAASRGGFLAFGSIIFIFWVVSKKKFKSVLLLLILIIIGLMFIPSKSWNELQQIDVDEQQGRAGERLYLWKLAGNMFQDNIIFGVGMCNYGELYTEYDRRAEFRDKLGGVNWRGQKMVAHSTPFTFLAETGVVGVVLLILLIYQIVRQLLYAIRNTKLQLYKYLGIACLASMLSFWIGSLFLTLTSYPFFYNIVLLCSIFLKIQDAGVKKV